MVTAAPPRIGSQTPRLRVLPAAEASGSYGPAVVEGASGLGVHLDQWQADLLRDGLAHGPDGKMLALEVGVEVPRQNGKTAVVGTLIVQAPQLLDARLVIYTAHEFKTALETYEYCLDLVESGPLADQLSKTRRSGTETGIEFRNGARIRFLARSRGSGRGFTSDLLILDEAYALQPHQVASVLPTLSARPNPQIWYLSSAPMPDSTQLHAVRGRAIKAAEGGQGTRALAYFGWGVDPLNQPEPMDRNGWYEANPGLGIRLTERFIETEAEAMTPEDFARERLGVPDDADSSPDLNLERWGELADPESKLVRPLGFGLDITPERDRSAYSVSGMRAADGLAHVEVVDHLAGTDWVVDRGVELWTRWQAPIWVQAGSPAAAYVDVLEARGVTVKVHPEGGGAATIMADAITSGTLRHLGQYSLSSALQGARRRLIGDRWVWARPAGVDVTALTSASLALFGALVEPPPPPKRRARIL